MSDFSAIYNDYRDELTAVIKDNERVLKQLYTLIIQRKDIQQDIYNSMLHIHSETQELVRSIMSDNINIDTIKKHNNEFIIEEEDEE